MFCCSFVFRSCFLLLVGLQLSTQLYAQPDTTATTRNDTTWEVAGITALNITQVAFSNWAQGGENSFSLGALANFSARYRKERVRWLTIGDFAYGITQVGDNPSRKNEDRIDVVSKFGYRARKNLYYSFLLNFRSQFAPGFNLPNDSVVASQFFSPAYLLLSLGMDYEPIDWVSVMAAPATGKITFVLDEALADSGAFGVTAAELNDTGGIVSPGENIRYEFGASVSVIAQKNWERFRLQSRLDLFMNYTNPVPENRWNIDVNWETLVAYSINDWLSLNLTTTLIYDHDVKVPIFEKRNGEEVQVGAAPRTQLKNVLGVGLSWKFGSKNLLSEVSD